MDYTPITALLVGMKVHTYIYTLMQYATNPHTHPPLPADGSHYPSCRQFAGLIQIGRSDLWLRLQVVAWKMLGVIKSCRGLQMQLQLWWRTHGEAPYHRCLLPSQLCRMKGEQIGFFFLSH